MCFILTALDVFYIVFSLKKAPDLMFVISLKKSLLLSEQAPLLAYILLSQLFACLLLLVFGACEQQRLVRKEQ
jgi:hypothetical protein